MSNPLALGLRQALESGDCVLFVGAGVGQHYVSKDGSSAPDGVTLAEELADHFGVEGGDSPDLAKVAQIIEIRKKGRTELETFIKRRLTDLEPDGIFCWLTTLRWKAIFTTNYDGAIERSFAKNPAPPQTPVTISATSDLVPFDRRLEVPVYHLHGALFGVDKPSIILTEDDYVQFRDRRRMLFEILKQEFATATFLYIGYSNRDPNWRLLLDEIRAEFYPSQPPISYRVSPDTNPLDEEILHSKGVETIAATFDDFQKTAAVALAGSRVSPDLLKRLESTIPKDLLPAFDKHPAAVARLLSSWEYVNQAPFNATPNISDFLRGNRANWALVGKHLNFERDIEPDLYDEILEYATSASQTPILLSVLGPAGYGTTTVLMDVAANVVSERAGAVFFHRPGTPFLEGDVEFASSVFADTCPIFVTDNAADHVLPLHNSLYRLKTLKRPSVFLIGERLNEWRSSHAKLSASEYLLEPLSDLEINKLLDCLTANNALNTLKDLTRELQFASIKQRYQKELLVAMREATEGKGFDAILEDEYRGIPTDLARRLYLNVCCFYQHGAYVRDGLLCELTGVPLSELYQLTSAETEGVVAFEEIDFSYGHFAARARHRTIAAVVWERVADSSERETIVLAAVSALNLNYRTDAIAFDNMVRSDRIVDSVRSLEDRIKFFEQACQKDPRSPYVRQHYARMLSRSKQPNLALGQIDQSLSITDDIKALHHTKGIILAKLALESESQDVARKRLAQSEAEFRRCITMYAKDEYAYQSLAQLYVDWARRASTEVESADYLSRAESVISEGLRTVTTRDGLWIVSASIQELLGNRPEYLKELERAVRSSPTSIVARYLLGRAYRRAGNPDKALAVLKPVIEGDTSEFRAFVEYAFSMNDLGEPYSKTIAVLRMSTLYGYSDPRFVGTLGGMLFMNEDFSAAKLVWNESFKREFPAEEAQRIQFRPRDPADASKRLELPGKIAALKLGYAFVDAPGLPSFFCHASKFGGLLMRPGMDVRFGPAFSARGAVVAHVRSA
jgi:tetratricopeptide (TPR) repeat protein